ncbi:MAG TPA: TonB-dependent receptor [Myxococcota bacterium]|jgi:hypothetical protein
MTLDARQKALAVNLDPKFYGTFAEIGAGQEVARWFFRVGGAAGTIAKTMSAYDMKVSDDIYGHCARYVSRERLASMLAHEHRLNLERLTSERGARTAFFAFADTVSARNFHGTNECHAWMGIRFQAAPGAPDSEIQIHVRMLDGDNALQQEAIGIVGVNLVYGASFLSHDHDALLRSLLDDLSTNRVEIDMVEFSGDQFKHVDNRLTSLRLVQLGFSPTAMFSPAGAVLQPSEALYKKPVLVQRGSFRPPTLVNDDMQRCARSAFAAEPDVEPSSALSIMELTLSNLNDGGVLDEADFLSRAEILCASGYTVLISDCAAYFRLAQRLTAYTSGKVGLVLGSGLLAELFDEKHYQGLDGGALEAFGRLFKGNVKLYVYPMTSAQGLLTSKTLELPARSRHLFNHLVQDGRIHDLDDVETGNLHIFSKDVLARIKRGDRTWRAMVAPAVAEVIERRGLFGCAPSA